MQCASLSAFAIDDAPHFVKAQIMEITSRALERKFIISSPPPNTHCPKAKTALELIAYS